jgi:hypothetical protein
VFVTGQMLQITESGFDFTGDSVEFLADCAGGVLKVRTVDSEPVETFIPASWVASI